MSNVILNLGVMQKKVDELKRQEREILKKKRDMKRTMRKPEVFYTGSLTSIILKEKFNHDALYWYLVNHFDNDDYHKLNDYRKRGLTQASKTNSCHINVQYKISRIGRLTIPNGIYYKDGEELKKFKFNDDIDINQYANCEFYKAVYGKVTEIKDGFSKLNDGKLNVPNSVVYQMIMKNHLKSIVCKDIYLDIDIVGCQINILIQLFEYHHIDNDAIKNFMNNREEIMKEIGRSLGWDRDEVKAFIFKLLFNDIGNIEYQLKKDGLNMNNFPQELKKFIRQTYDGRTELLSHYPDIVHHAKIKKSNKQYNWNIDGCALAYLLQSAEKNCLIHMYEFFTNIKNIGVGALIHDGLHLEKVDNIKEILTECEEYVFNKTGFRIKLLVKDFKKEKPSITKRFNELDNIDNIPGIEIEKIHSRYLTSKENDGNINLAPLLDGTKVNLVKSFTGSGKTEMMKALKSLYPVDILSLVSRRSLSDKHAEDFEIAHYRDVHMNHSTNEVYQADSIDKIPDIKNDYILIIDEVASFGSHMLNKMNKMSRNRIKFVMKLSALMNHPNCKMVIGADHNINTGTVQFIKSLTTKQVKLYINEFKPVNDKPVKIFHSISKIKNAIIRSYKDGDQVFICSNKNKRFMKNVIEPIIKHLNLVEGIDYLVYTGKRGLDRVNTSDWKDIPIIIASPAIVYGCDSNKINVHIFGFYFNSQHFDAMDAIQQLSRERSPLSINLFVEDIRSDMYENIEETKLSTQIPNVNILLGTEISIEFVNAFKSVSDLYFYEAFRRSHHLNMRYYLVEQLKKKGYSNFILDDSSLSSTDIGVLSEKEYDELTMKLIEFGTDDKTIEQVTKRLNSLRFFSTDIPNEKEFNKRYQTLMNDPRTKKIIYDDKTYLEYQNLMMWKYEYYDDDDYLDIPELQMRRVKNKIKILKQLELLIFDGQDDDNELEGLDDLINSLIVTFELKSKGRDTRIISKKRGKLKEIYWKFLYNILGNCVSKKIQRSRISGVNKRTCIYSMNDNLIDHYVSLSNISKEYTNLKRKNTNMFGNKKSSRPEHEIRET